DGIEVDVDADGARFLRRQFARVVGELLVAGGGDGHGQRQPRGAEQHVAGTALEVRGDQQRQFRHSLHFVDGQRVAGRIAAEGVVAADVKVDDVAADGVHLVRVDGTEAAGG